MEKQLCVAKLSDETTCSSKAKEGHRFCAAHLKFAPRNMNPNSTTMDITVKELVKGIHYFVDDRYVYSHGEVLGGKENPSKIGEYVKEADTYTVSWF
jgi:hypothetical protein